MQLLAAVMIVAVSVAAGASSTYFQYFDQAKTYSQAEAACVELGGHLPSIASETENEAVILAKNKQKPQCAASDEHVWIGLNDIKSKNAYQWTDNTAYEYKKWGASEPSHNEKNKEEERCAAIYTCPSSDLAKKWNDILCSASPGYVCELPSPPKSDPEPFTAETVSATVTASAVYGSVGGSAAGSLFVALLTWLANTFGERILKCVLGKFYDKIRDKCCGPRPGRKNRSGRPRERGPAEGGNNDDSDDSDRLDFVEKGTAAADMAFTEYKVLRAPPPAPTPRPAALAFASRGAPLPREG